MILEKNPNIQVRKSILHGLGVFATNDIPGNTLLEECHGAILSKEEFDTVKEIPAIACNTFSVSKTEIILPYGYGAIYNSKKNANVKSIYNVDRKILSFYTTKDIKMHEELFLDYEMARKFYKNKNIQL
jgi:SET domain-containing protein